MPYFILLLLALGRYFFFFSMNLLSYFLSTQICSAFLTDTGDVTTVKRQSSTATRTLFTRVRYPLPALLAVGFTRNRKPKRYDTTSLEGRTLSPPCTGVHSWGGFVGTLKRLIYMGTSGRSVRGHASSEYRSSPCRCRETLTTVP